MARLFLIVIHHCIFYQYFFPSKNIGTNDDTEIVDDPSFVNVSKLAVQYSDAAIQGSPKINPEITEYIQDSGKMFLDYQPEHTYIDAYNEFYDKILL